MDGTIRTSENCAAAAALVDRNGGVLDEELVTFGAPDEPEAVSFHGHGFPAVYQLRRRLDARGGVKWHQSPAGAEKQSYISVPLCTHSPPQRARVP